MTTVDGSRSDPHVVGLDSVMILLTSTVDSSLKTSSYWFNEFDGGVNNSQFSRLTLIFLILSMKNCKWFLAHSVSSSCGRITFLSLPMIWLSVLYSFFVLVPHLLNFSLMHSPLVLQSSFLYLDLRILSHCLTLGS